MSESRRKRILFVSSSMGEGGAQRVTSTILQRLDRSRFEPLLCLLKDKVSYRVPDDVRLVSINQIGDQTLAEVARKRPWIVMSTILALRQSIRELEPDIVFSNLEQVNCVTGSALMGLVRRPRWVARLGADPSWESRLDTLWSRFAYQRADVVVANSTGLSQGFADKYPTFAGRLRTILNPTDFEYLEQRAAEPAPRQRPPGAPLLMFAGRLARQKRLDLLLNALESLRREHAVRLWICGAGPLGQHIEHEIAARGLKDQVELLGFQDNLHSLMRQADVFVMTSDWEGLPNVLIEAQGLGLPVVSTRCNYGPAEVVVEGETGFLTAPGDAQATAQALSRLLSDAALRERMAGAAARLARQRFDAATLVRAWEDVFEGTA